MFRKSVILAWFLVLSGCGIIFGSEVNENKNIILATTTSVQDTGLLDVLVDVFAKKTGFTVKAIAVGTGQAIQMGKNGEADILWVHSPDDEIQFVNEGYGMDRTTFMRNDFVVLGPKDDPAKIKGIEKAASVFKKIAGSKVLFVSRGDKSGTHKKELKLWKESGVDPARDNYIEIGQGMAATVRVANEKQGYVLCDRSTYLSLKNTIDLIILSQGDPLFENRYSLILVNPLKFPKVNVSGAKTLFDFLLSEDSKGIVEDFGKGKFGEQLFFWDYKI